MDVYFWVDDVHARFAEFSRSGARIDSGLVKKPYGIHEFGLKNSDGPDLGYAQEQPGVRL